MGDPALFRDFRNLLYVVWKHLGLPEPTEVQYDIADFMQQGIDRCVVEAWRGIGKSYIAAAYTTFVLGRAPDTKVLVVSAGRSLASDFTQFTLKLINEIPALHFLRPRADDRDSRLSFDVGPTRGAKDPSVFAVGLSGQMTGRRADLIIADDIETPKTSETVHQREKLANKSREFEAIIKPGGQIMYLGTPQCEDSLYPTLPERGYTIRVWPVQVPTATQRPAYGTWLAPLVESMLARPGAPVDPVRFPAPEIEKRRIGYGPAGFALQFMLDPTLSDTELYPLKQRDLLVMPIDPIGVPLRVLWSPTSERHADDLSNIGLRGDRIFRALVLPQDDANRVPLDGIVMAIDPSGRGADETGYATGSAKAGFAWLLDAGGVPGVSDGDLDHLCSLIRRWGVTEVVCEPNYGGGMFTKLMEAALLRNKVRASVSDAPWATGRKEKRIIETLYPLISGHRLVVNTDIFTKDANSVSHLPVEKGLPYRLFHQLTRLSHKPGCLVHDDRLEAVAILCSHLAERATVDQHQAQQRERQEEWEREMERFERAVGLNPAGARRRLRK